MEKITKKRGRPKKILSKKMETLINLKLLKKEFKIQLKNGFDVDYYSKQIERINTIIKTKFS